jgi:hypothetical protein
VAGSVREHGAVHSPAARGDRGEQQVQTVEVVGGHVGVEAWRDRGDGGVTLRGERGVSGAGLGAAAGRSSADVEEVALFPGVPRRTPSPMDPPPCAAAISG